LPDPPEIGGFHLLLVIVMSELKFSIDILFSFTRNADGRRVEARAGQRFGHLQIDAAHFRILQAEGGDGAREGFDEMEARAFREIDDLPDQVAVIDGFVQIVASGGFVKVQKEFNGYFDETASRSFFWIASEDA
jgi:hypothetical protein